MPWPASLAKRTSVPFTERPSLGNKMENDRGRCLIACTGLHTCLHIPTHSWTYITPYNTHIRINSSSLRRGRWWMSTIRFPSQQSPFTYRTTSIRAGNGNKCRKAPNKAEIWTRDKSCLSQRGGHSNGGDPEKCTDVRDENV